ncbi:DNA/RNA non-specific endonuclease [Gordonia sp. CPCC 206044]|uniref:DNA/RNA non-specific endonuclease n=1 Tax=Gordonia sp. CPCC 206044 TaxID=3140793 RepID=UPI003AF39DD8
MTRIRAILITLFLTTLIAAGIHSVPGMSAPAGAATNCSTLQGRIAGHNADARNYNAQVTAINARGGGNASQVAYYNAWRARGIARGNALNAELLECQRHGQLSGVRPPVQPGGQRPAPPPRATPKPRSNPTPRAQPQRTNPTPGYRAPSGLSAKARKNGITSRESRQGERILRARDGGNQTYQRMLPGRSGPSRAASGASAVLSPKMRYTGTATRSGRTGDRPPGFRPGGRCQRGHLIGSQLGGMGTDPRNIVTLSRSANIAMRSVENQVGRYVDQGIRVNYRVIPIYGNGPNAQPTTIRMIAYGLGMVPIFKDIPNPRCW